MDRAVARLISITAVDKADGTYELIYTFQDKSELVNIRFAIQEEWEIDSIADMYPGALNFEREIIDLFGLKFKGVKGGLVLVPESGVVNPLRKKRAELADAAPNTTEVKHG
jgi:NADH:ubiquinone oxidoreductase subunit C